MKKKMTSHTALLLSTQMYNNVYLYKRVFRF